MAKFPPSHLPRLLQLPVLQALPPLRAGPVYKTASCPLLLPREAFAAMYMNYRDPFKKTFSAGSFAIRAFWAGQTNHPFFKDLSLIHISEPTRLALI
eukprot:14414298-Alexandrium_andersonii.AAC.1